MRGLIIMVSFALVFGAAYGTSGATGNGVSGSVTADQARQIIQAAGYVKIGPLERSKDDDSWETTAMIDGVPYVVDVDRNGLLVSR